MGDGERSGRALGRAVARGLRGRCPNCGQGRLLAGYIRPEPQCAACGEDFRPYGTADFAPYLVTFAIGLTFIPLALVISLTTDFAGWIVWALMAGAALTAAFLLPRAKGAAIGLLWALDVRS